MNRAPIERALAMAKQRAFERAKQASAIAADEHQRAPRGGVNKNQYGQMRSAPGEPPAPETGRLGHLLQAVRVDEGGRAAVNYTVLEFGYSVGARSRISDKKNLAGSTLEPRPLGVITAARLKAEVRNGTLKSTIKAGR